MHSKFEVFVVFKHFFAYVNIQFSYSIKIMRFDYGGKYMSNDFIFFLQDEDIIFQKSCLNTPQQNGIAKRKFRHLLDNTRSLLLASSIPFTFLG